MPDVHAPKLPREEGDLSGIPQGIPDEIYVGGFDHRQPFKGDQGIRFDLKPGADNDLKDWVRLYVKGSR